MPIKCMFVAVLAACSFVPAGAAAQDDAGCRAARYKAAAGYASCEKKAMIKFARDPIGPFLKCRSRLYSSWSGLASRYPGTVCDAARFVDNGDGTVTDNLTNLVWEKKANLDGAPNASDPHDADNKYSWTSADGNDTDEDGTAFTDFLASLNAGAGFAGANGWRLPTAAELNTIFPPSPCPPVYEGQPVVACIESAFGPTVGLNGLYWTSTTFLNPVSDGVDEAAWTLHFGYGGYVGYAKPVAWYARAVRGGF